MQRIVPNMGPCEVPSCARKAHWITEDGLLLCTNCARLHDDWQERDEEQREIKDAEQLPTRRGPKES